MANPPSRKGIKLKKLHDHLTDDSSGPISIRELSKLLDTKPEELKPLVDHFYLRIVFRKPDFPDAIVSKPSPGAMEWLKLMFQPVYLRPLIRLSEVPSMLEPYYKNNASYKKDASKLLEKLRKVCLTYKIPIHSDLVMGELLSINDLQKLVRRWSIYKNPTSYDRATILAFLLNALPKWYRWDETCRKGAVTPRLLKVPYYTARLNAEIGRVAKLPIEQRVPMAMQLYEAWRDARSVQECLYQLKSYEEAMKELKAEGYRWEGNPGIRMIKRILKTNWTIEKLKNAVIELED
jgi:hypothetical protein